MQSPKTKRLVVDLDGTICEQTSGGDAYFSARPIPATIAKLRQFAAAGWVIYVFTARGMNEFRGRIDKIEEKYRDGTEQWLEDHDVPWDYLRFGKPAGDLYVDDKGVSVDEFVSTEI